jgi:hypothetical protein
VIGGNHRIERAGDWPQSSGSRLATTVVELRGEKRESWPSGPSERDDARRPNNRKILGARHWFESVTSPGTPGE